MFCQCRIQKKLPDGGRLEEVAWIPEKFAHVHRVIKIKQDDGEWDDGWVVYAAYREYMRENPPDSHTCIKTHRKATGDSMPKERK